MKSLRLTLASLVAAVPVVAFAATSMSVKGPSSSLDPYVVPLTRNTMTVSLLTVGDSVNNKPNGTPYRMVGIPDGMGAYDNNDGTFTVLLNHELPANTGVERAHGAIGSFVSKWTIRKDDLSVVRGEDLIQTVATWNPSQSAYEGQRKGVVIGRLCSADLPPASAFFNQARTPATTAASS